METPLLRPYILVTLLFLQCLSVKSTAQGINLGIPPIRNFSKKIYQAGTQNWDAAQDRRGVLYFANNEGLLQFDGNRWQCFPVANKTVVRSVAIDEEGRIFVGAQSELGYFFPEKNGQLRYHSLAALLPPEKRNFEDVWDIAVYDSVVFFRTRNAVFEYHSRQMRIHEPGGELTAMYESPLGLLIQKDYAEIQVFDRQSFQPLCYSPELKSELSGVLRWSEDTLLIATLKNGLFCYASNQLSRWRTADDALFQEKRIYSATALPNGHIVLGSSLDGCVELDRNRRIFRHLTKKNGLQNNNILHTFADRAGNLWLGLDNGIDCVILPSAFTALVPDAELQGTGYAAAVHDEMLYLGVSNGVYQTRWQTYYNPEKKPYFEKIKASDGQVWSLRKLGNELLLGHHEGTFRLSDGSCRRIAAEPGAWTFVELNERYLLGGNYSGLVLYRKLNGAWEFDQKLEGLNESCRFMVKDAVGAIWVAHPYRGLYRIEWSEAQKTQLKVRFYNAQNGLPSDLNNLVFLVAGNAVFATEKGIYRFDIQRDGFVPDEDFDQILGKGNPVKYLCEDATGNIWYVGEKEVGRLEIDDLGLKKKVRKRVFPELAEKLVAGFEFVFPADEDNVFFGAEQGFIHFNAKGSASRDTVLQVVLGQVTAGAMQDSVVFGGSFLKGGKLSAAQDEDLMPVLEAEMNSLRFYFSATRYEDPAYLQYRFKLEGLHDEWSEWSGETLRNFTNLGPGTYCFSVQARHKNGQESAVLRFKFRIRPPWYASTAAQVLYALAFLGLFAGYIIRQRRKFENEKENMTVQHQQITAEQQRKVEESKAALSDILREKLEADIQFKNKELATATMHLVQKGEILHTIQENLNQILDKSTNPAVKKEVQQLLNLLNFDAKLDEDWEQFAVHFDQVHVNFLKKLRERHPELSQTDYKLCAYLRMNLTTKEIAPLMNISVRGVEASRYRLRKKLGLPNDANLTEVIANL
ncbi:MAG: triple tyrosine motif-containing protein [Saprospiraceae bacterium]|nr:triple tyrosine motif-containing protein [Saprospiraceae bacterium]